jgi:hypothetical protein
MRDLWFKRFPEQITQNNPRAGILHGSWRAFESHHMYYSLNINYLVDLHSLKTPQASTKASTLPPVSP